jgi:uncharacterized protein (DUF488 family)
MNTMSSIELFTIGHSTHEIGIFVELLRSHGISVVVDVRSHPYSKFNPQFNRENLKSALSIIDISYIFLGEELGARSDDPTCYDHGRVMYGRLAKSAAFRAGLENVIRMAAIKHLALMCAEKEPLDCHRSILIGRTLDEGDVVVKHILSDGSIMTQTELASVLLKDLGLAEDDLFMTRGEALKKAYVIQEERIAYIDERLSEANTMR